MPRVIEEIPRRERTAVCPHCGYTIAFVANDIISRTGRDISGSSDTDYYVVCPKAGCRKEIRVDQYDQSSRSRSGWPFQ